MTAHLIDPAAVAAIQARRAAQPAPAEAPVPVHLTARRAASLTSTQWRRAVTQTMDLLTSHLQEALRRDDGTEIAAQLMHHSLDLLAYGIAEHAGHSPDPRRNVREQTDATLQTIWEGLRSAIEEGVELYRADIHAEQRAQLDAEREQMTHAADQAQLDATETRRQLDAASAQLTREREVHAREAASLRDQLARERQAVIDRDRETRNRIQQLEHDLAEGRKVIAHLNAECTRLEDHLTAPQEAPMPEPIPAAGPQNALETASLCHYLNEAEWKGYTWSGTTIRADGRTIDFFDAPILAAWRSKYPTPASMQAQLRALVLPILGRAA